MADGDAECRIENFALIGDCETAALVGRDGCVAWLCWPRFDSDACFASLLGSRENGHWRIAPTDPNPEVSRRYREGSLILETTFETTSGAVRLIDFMPPRGEASDVVRIVEGVSGEVELAMELTVRFGYGRVVPWVTRLEDGTLRAVAGPDMVVLRTPVPFEGADMATVARFTVRPGERVPFVLTYQPSHRPIPGPVDAEAALADAAAFWAEWSGRYEAPAGDVPPHWDEAIRRSLLTLKALTYRPTGGIAAAATTSLPEWIGGGRNWDYRYCWLRDAALTLQALVGAGHYGELRAWRDWLRRTLATQPRRVQI
ncbi:MAG: glycoside hydrolase family 15 protein, partial [Methylobacteriaceae bacterium]|nr:glycoside hydrolase family 15 protein [Methylobacteriaceae bacterium]